MYHLNFWTQITQLELIEHGYARILKSQTYKYM